MGVPGCTSSIPAPIGPGCTNPVVRAAGTGYPAQLENRNCVVKPLAMFAAAACTISSRTAVEAISHRRREFEPRRAGRLALSAALGRVVTTLSGAVSTAALVARPGQRASLQVRCRDSCAAPRRPRHLCADARPFGALIAMSYIALLSARVESR